MKFSEGFYRYRDAELLSEDVNLSVSKRCKKENVLNHEPQKVGFLANAFAQPAPIGGACRGSF